ncbi:uncharacterized protein A4U43_C02F12700 [Asparagus officinalis]|uniref:Uncharacterized protein n=1 Tax=Asparagus officinalis TaxID=4686 RepID=A0A5P1FKK9_ASPOF|nr:uncharacterized protein A4U43_C02F12700 [Asparagus officinalis]
MSSKNRDVNEVVEISPSQGVGFWSENVELYFIDLMEEETHKYARYFRRKGCKGYDKLCIIFGDTTATGDHAHPSTKSPTISKDDNEEEGEDEEDVESSRAKKKAKVANKRVPLNQQIQLAMVEALTSMGENSRKKMELGERKMSSS